MTEIAITGPCMACVVGFFEECHNPEILEDGWIIPCAVRFKFIEDGPVKRAPGEIGRPLSDPSEITDIKSTGRKRAAIALPIFTGMVCQWAGLKWAGGGAFPIVGCRGNTLAEIKKHDDLPEGIDSRGERHHGPNKNVLDNSVGVNLHGICSSCHHRWHELNDPTYGSDRPTAELEWYPADPYWMHDPYTKASEEDIVASEEWWETPKKDRPAFPVETPPEDRLREPQEIGILTSDNPFEDPDLNPFDIPAQNGE